MDKIKEAQEILKDLGLPESQQNKVCALTLLALGGIRPDDEWDQIGAKSVTLSKDIIDFVNTYYDTNYKPNTRESFRKNALKPFVENNIALLNPDDPTLKPTSSKTHYALSDITVTTLRNYNTLQWQHALDNFKKRQFPENTISVPLLSKIEINNYKSILNDTIELGQFNVFIGANGCGKSNILEAIATVGASMANEFNFEGLYNRGVRMARPDLTTSSFVSLSKKDSVDINFEFDFEGKIEQYRASLTPKKPNDFYTEWIDKNNESIDDIAINNITQKLLEEYNKNSISGDTISTILSEGFSKKNYKSASYYNLLTEYAIFNLNTKSLRGVIPADSRKTPLGINGEGLDILISNFNSYERSYLKDCQYLVDWLDSIFSDKDDNSKKTEGLKPGRSSSTLYFKDKYMQKQNNTFSAENSNEGILHILFYISLFVSNKTPNLFSIDNIETALNPKVCQELIKILVNLAKKRGKQALITTHNPAVLDGLNLLDESQRLFVVSRDSQGKTRTRRIMFKPDLSDKRFKLSDMWLKGLLGAIPKNF